jgi:hypothetical protein
MRYLSLYDIHDQLDNKMENTQKIPVVIAVRDC